MARITIEDCLKAVENRFELVLLAAKRSRDLASGAAEPNVGWENDKSTVVALREIEEGHISADYQSVNEQQTQTTVEMPIEQANSVTVEHTEIDPTTEK